MVRALAIVLDRFGIRAPTAVAAVLLLSLPAGAQLGWVLDGVKIYDGGGGFGGPVDERDEFGTSVAVLGDVDGDGVPDLAVGGAGQMIWSEGPGSVWILFMNPDGTVRASQQISEGIGGFDGGIVKHDYFGRAIAPLGDLDGNGVPDLVVGAPTTVVSGDPAALWVLFLNADGTVAAEQEISAGVGGFGGPACWGDSFGMSLASIGDWNNDGTSDLAVGAPEDGDGGPNRGAIWLLFLQPDGTVGSELKISDTAGGFSGGLVNADYFGISVAALDDIDGDGIRELAVGAHGDDDLLAGAVWILFMNPDGTVNTQQKISGLAGDFGGELESLDHFGWSVADAGDLNGDGVGDLIVGNPEDDEGPFLPFGPDFGAVWILFLRPDGTVAEECKLGALHGGMQDRLRLQSFFGWSTTVLRGLDGTDSPYLVAGLPFDHDGGNAKGAIWVLLLNDGRARSLYRNDSANVNPAGYYADPPVAGTLWRATVDNTGTGNFVAGIMGFARPLEFHLPLAGGFLLIDPLSAGGELLGLSPGLGYGPVPFEALIPPAPELVGFLLSTQGAGLGGSAGLTLHNARDLVIGH